MIVTFDPVEFREFYPKYTEKIATDAQLENFFNTAVMLIGNDDNSRFPYDPDAGVYDRKTLLYLLVCHLATLNTWQVGQTGPLTSASQGSVSIGYGQAQMGTAEWYGLSQCGQTFWALTLKYRKGGLIYTPSNFHPYG